MLTTLINNLEKLQQEQKELESLKEEILVIAPWISAIDNGIAIAQVKNKIKQKSLSK
jgi:hypothetical protein